MTGQRARSRPARWTARLATLLTVLAVALLTTAGPASAHDVLISSDPADGAVLTSAPATVTFTFDQPVQNFEPVLEVIGPNGNTFGGTPTVSGTSISAPMAAGPEGAYRAVYRVVSADGHPVTGEISFTLTADAAGTAIGEPTDAAAASSAEAGMDMNGSSGSLTPWRWVGIGVAVVLLVLAVMRLKSWRETREPGPRPPEE